MLLQLVDCLGKPRDTSTKRTAFLTLGTIIKPTLTIKMLFKSRIRVKEKVTTKKSEEDLLANLYTKSKTKTKFKVIAYRNNKLVIYNDSLKFARKGRLIPREEAVFCYI
ncbi:hypothetical protein CWI38_0250p0040 [Hamiltosporidium tvaerminnensis]|uniref:Uncharacterized protein n=1 Tax=Hamiltosporidium tvaerminnensis TaxID=1176355 RepID=A0A4Q9M077_9MICR|nr:hypothetical protein CWI38_0250p0040 [Hamiltosporidium tvaerminnensis]